MRRQCPVFLRRQMCYTEPIPDKGEERMKENTQGRLLYADLLRALAMVAVIVVHVCGNNWPGMDVRSTEWQILNGFDSLVRWCVPVFVMLSGMFFLDPQRNVTYQSTFRKNLPRIAAAFLIWSTFYALYTAFFNSRAGTPDSLGQIITNIAFGHYHLWFLYMIMGLYLITPILRLLIKGASRRDLEYFLLLYFVFTLFLPAFNSTQAGQVVSGVVYRLDLKALGGYIGYYVAGYYFRTYDFTPKVKKLIYAAGILGVVWTWGMTVVASLEWNAPNETWFLYLTPNVAMMSVGLFLFFKEHCHGTRLGKRGLAFCLKVSRLSFGMYLVHAFFNSRLVALGLNAVTWTPLAAVPVATALVFLFSFVAAWIMSHIPFLRKYGM